MTLTRTLVRAAAALTATGLVATGAVAQSASIVKKPVPGADGLAVARADDPELARAQAAAGARVIKAVDSVNIELSRAIGL